MSSPGAAPQGRDQPTQGAIPAFHKGRLHRRAELVQAPLLAKTAWATEDSTPADRHDMASRVAHLDHRGVKQSLGGPQPGLRLAADFPTTLATRHDPQNLQERRRRGLPPVRETEGESPRASDDLRAQRCCRVLVTRSEVDPQEEPTPHGQRGMPPFHLLRTQFGMRLIPLHPLHLQVLHALAGVHLSPMGPYPLEAMDRLEIHGTDGGRARITDAPALTFQELC